jgi:hypothetical protein
MLLSLEFAGVYLVAVGVATGQEAILGAGGRRYLLTTFDDSPPQRPFLHARAYMTVSRPDPSSRGGGWVLMCC